MHNNIVWEGWEEAWDEKRSRKNFHSASLVFQPTGGERRTRVHCTFSLDGVAWQFVLESAHIRIFPFFPSLAVFLVYQEKRDSQTFGEILLTFRLVSFCFQLFGAFQHLRNPLTAPVLMSETESFSFPFSPSAS